MLSLGSSLVCTTYAYSGDSLRFPTTCPSKCTVDPSFRNPLRFSSPFTVNCHGHEPLSTSSAYVVLGLVPNCSQDDLKAAFRTKVKQFHPDVRRDGINSDVMIRRVIQAYEILSNYSKSEIIEMECLDPFEKPECKACDLFINEVLCMGKDSVKIFERFESARDALKSIFVAVLLFMTEVAMIIVLQNDDEPKLKHRAPNWIESDKVVHIRVLKEHHMLSHMFLQLGPHVLLLKDMVKIMKFNLQSVSAQEAVSIMSHLFRE